MKFVENLVDQQAPGDQLMPFLSDAVETPADNPLTMATMQDDAMATSSSPPTGPFSGSNDCPFTDNLYYGFTQVRVVSIQNVVSELLLSTQDTKNHVTSNECFREQ